jgi:hypothetical protein
MQPNSHPLAKTVDQAKVNQGFYAVVDPFDQARVLYVTERGYLSLVRVCLSNETNVVVLASPNGRVDSAPLQDASSEKKGGTSSQ